MEVALYQHYKGGYYYVQYTAKNSETDEEMVVYKAVYDDSIWVTSFNMFNGFTEVDGVTIKRFKFIR
jgi:hypothetical protein